MPRELWEVVHDMRGAGPIQECQGRKLLELLQRQRLQLRVLALQEDDLALVYEGRYAGVAAAPQRVVGRAVSSGASLLVGRAAILSPWGQRICVGIKQQNLGHFARLQFRT
jgi:hypothetical protein